MAYLSQILRVLLQMCCISRTKKEGVQPSFFNAVILRFTAL